MYIYLLLIIFLILFIVFYLKFSKKIEIEKLKNLDLEKDILIIKENNKILLEKINDLKDQILDKNSFNQRLQSENLEIYKQISSKEENIRNLNEQLDNLKKDLDKNYEKFENMANKILTEKSEVLLKNNSQNIGILLNPLSDQIKEFKEKVENYYVSENVDRGNLKTEIKNLIDLNRKVSDDANNLAKALKNDVKIQGNWGELQLKKILDYIGLQEGVHYEMQENFVEEGKRNIPDCIVKMPDERNLIIDSKVSLVHYEQFFSSEKDEEKEFHLKEHLKSINSHIENLASKDYANKVGNKMKSIDFVMLFIPIESALSLASQYDKDIYEKAIKKNIIIVTNSTLIATLRTIEYIWRQEGIKKNYIEIAKVGGEIYDKFVNFVKDLEDIGKNIDKSKEFYENAMKKLKTSARKGDSLIGKAEKLKELGVNSNKKLDIQEIESF
jgi:DNA recombination protein RmuC